MFNPKAREDFYRRAANNFANSALIRRLTAIVHVEGETDVDFWRQIFSHYYPTGKFHFIYYSKSTSGIDSSGSTQCLNYLQFLSKRFFVCIDSDNKYVMGESTLSIKDFVFQTYTYSIENHYCYAPHLNYGLKKITKSPNVYFNFSVFLKRYSNIIYDLLIWHIYLTKNGYRDLDIIPFNNIITHKGKIAQWQLNNNGRSILDKIQRNVNTRITSLRNKYPDIQLDEEHNRCKELGLNRDNAYLFVRGHHIYNLVTKIGQIYCDTYYRNSNRRRESRNNTSFRKVVTDSLYFDNYLFMNKIGNDITNFFQAEKL